MHPIRLSMTTRSHRRSSSPTVRAGLTLFEVLLSLVIFVGAMTAVGQLLDNGVRGSAQARYHTEAAILCEAKLSEVIAGVIQPQSVQNQEFPDTPEWSWSMAVGPGNIPQVVKVVVTVERTAVNNRGRVKYQLSRLMRDPEVYASAAATEAAAAEASSSSSSSSSSGEN